MLTIPAAISSPVITVLPPSVVATPSDAVSTRQTSAAVAAPLSNLPLGNDSRSSATVAASASTENTEPAATSGAAATTEGSAAAGGPSTAFLTQLFAQDTSQDEDNVSIAATFARFSPAPTYNTLVGYGFVKYKPSDAGLQPPRSGLPSAILSGTAVGSDASEIEPQNYNAYHDTQSRNQTNLAVASSQLIVAG